MGRLTRCLLPAAALCLACSHAEKVPPPAPVPAASSASSTSSASSAPAADAPEPALRTEQRIGKATDALSATLYRYAGPASHGRVWVARVLPAKARIALVPAPHPEPLAKIVAAHEPSGDYVAVNGGFYDNDRPMGLVVAGGKRIAPLDARGGSGVFFMEADRAAIVHRDAFTAKRPALALQSIDRLVDGGRSLVTARGDARRDARSAVAIDAQGAVMLVVAFDERAAFRTSDSVIQMSPASTTTGPTLQEFAELLAGELGARTALNLDGGFSTAMRLHLGATKLEVIAHKATINAIVAHLR